MKTIRSHWALAYKSVKKAIAVTISIAASSLKAKIYIIKNQDRLENKRRTLAKLLEKKIME